MTPLQLLQQRERAIKRRLGEIGALAPDEVSDEVTAEADGLQAEYQGLQTRMSAAATAEAAAITGAPPAGDGRDPRLAELVGQASPAEILDAFAQHRMVAGPERDLQQHLKLDANQIPLALVAPPRPPVALAEDHDERQRRALTLTGDGPAMQQPVVGGMYPTGELAFCNTAVVPVGSGLQVFPYVSVPASSAASAPANAAAGAEVADIDQTLVLSNASPNRIPISVVYQQEQQRLVRSVPEDLQANLNDLLQAGLTRFGLNATDKGLLERGTDPTAPTATVTWASFLSSIASGVDGVYARRLRDVKALVRTTTYSVLTGLYRANETDVTAAEWAEEKSGGLMASAYPKTASNDDQALLIKGMHDRSSVLPLWDSLSLMDAMTESRSGVVRLTLAGFCDFAVLRPDAYVRTAFQTTS